MASPTGDSGRKVAWLTAADGFGGALALALAESGWSVGVTDPDPRAVSALNAELEQFGASRAFVADIGSAGDAARAVETVVGALGPLYALVNVPRAQSSVPALEIAETDWRQAVDRNVVACFLCAQAAARVLVQSGRGRIVNISSDTAERGVPGTVTTACTAGSINSLTRVFAVELAPLGIRVNSLGLGPVAPEADDEAIGRVPVGRLGTAADCLGVLAFLLSDAADWITGTVVHVDGGVNGAALVVQAAES